MTTTPEQLYKRGIAELELQLRQRDQQIAALEKQVAELKEQNTQLSEQVIKLTDKIAKLSKNCCNSSKPPSSDIVKPPRKIKGNSLGKKGAQPGHTRHERTPFSPEQIDSFYQHSLDVCPDCGGVLKLVENAARVVQQVEIIEKPIYVEQHTSFCYWCQHCCKFHYGPLPPQIEKGQLIGPGLTTLVAYMKGACHCSFSTIRKFLRDVVGLTISRGQLSKLVYKTSNALQQAYNELLERLPFEIRLNVDETGHNDNGDRFWTWCFRAAAYSLFRIADTRSSKVLFDVLGEDFAGVLGCDYFSAYRKYMKDCNILVQFCLAHLIRELRYLTGLCDQPTAAYGERLLKAVCEMFGIFHQRQQITQQAFIEAMNKSREAFLANALTDVPQTRQAQNLANRFHKYGDAYFRFITTPDIEPTNNLVEQAIRFVVIDRHVTQGTRGQKGRAWCERIWTVLATCAVQGRSAFDFISQSIQAYFCNQAAPSLLHYP